MKVVAIIQARMGSTRLPGKVLMDLGGHPVLEWCVRAASAAPGVDEVWVATSKLSLDDRIAAWCSSNNVRYWRGSETDVLSRFVGCAKAAGADVLLRLTGDCPFLDPQVIGTVVRMIRDTPGAHYVSNVSPRTYPDGLDVEAFHVHALRAADAEATRPIDRDCVTTFISRNRSRFPGEAVINPLPGMEQERWVLDTKEDLEFCQHVAQRWPWDHGAPTQLDILNILDRDPDIRIVNADAIMNERYFDALAEEPIYARSYDRSQEAFARASKTIPLAAQTFSKSHLQYPQPSPLFVSHGQGGLVYDVDGNEYVDLVSALLPSVLGYRDPDVDTAVRRQLASGVSFSLATELEAELSETLCRIIPCAEAVRFGKTGTDVTSAAIRLARAFTGRDRILICGGYHGWQDWSVERNLGVPLPTQFLKERVPFGDMEATEAAFHTGERHPPLQFAACIVEPETSPDYLQFLRKECDTRGIVLIFDEIITGFRFAMGGAQELYGVTPDLATFGKAMANGLPLSAIVGRRDIMAKFAPPDNIFYSGTMFGETLSLAAGIATIQKMERESVIEKLWNTGVDFGSAFRRWQMVYNIDHDVVWASGLPPFRRLHFRDDKIAALFRKEMIASGTLIVGSINVCAAHTAADVKRVGKSFEHTFGVIRHAVDRDMVDELLAGASVAPMVRAS